MSQSASEGSAIGTQTPLDSASEADLAEGVTPQTGAADSITIDPEAPLADALEQHAEVQDETPAPLRDLPLEAEAADVVEQAQPAGFGEDDYRAP